MLSKETIDLLIDEGWQYESPNERDHTLVKSSDYNFHTLVVHFGRPGVYGPDFLYLTERGDDGREWGIDARNPDWAPVFTQMVCENVIQYGRY